MGKILLVDDDLQLLATYSDALQEDKHIITKVSNVLDTLHALKSEKFDLIITDLKMEKLTGSKLIDLLQLDQDHLPCPVIISSGFIDSHTIYSFAKNELIHFLPKPASKVDLLAKAKEVLLNPISKNKIDVRFINPVLNSAVEVLTKMTAFKISSSKPYIKKASERSGDISGVVGVVSSGFKGTISISFSEKGFLAVVSKILKEETTEIDDENKDAVAELMNIIFATARKILNQDGMNIQPAIPMIIRGKDHSISHHSQNHTIVIPFTCTELGDFRIEVSTIGSS